MSLTFYKLQRFTKAFFPIHNPWIAIASDHQLPVSNLLHCNYKCHCNC